MAIKNYHFERAVDLISDGNVTRFCEIMGISRSYYYQCANKLEIPHRLAQKTAQATKYAVKKHQLNSMFK